MEPEKRCAFCDGYRLHVNVHNFKSKHPEYYGGPQPLQEIRVAMVIRDYYKGNKSHAVRTTDYQARGIGYKLIYCPECGKKLGGKRNHDT